MFSAATDVEPVEQEVDEPAEENEEDVHREKRLAKHKQDRTDSNSLNRKRLDAVNGLAKKLQVNFQRHRQTLFWTPDKKVRVCAAVSKRYDSQYKPYWYAYHPHWDEFLDGGEQSFFILACMDRDEAFAIPHDVVRENLGGCSQTDRGTKSYWHIALSHDTSGRVVWDITRVQRKVNLDEFSFETASETTAAPALL